MSLFKIVFSIFKKTQAYIVMKKLIVFLFILIPLKNFAVDFFKGTYAEALEKCKKENKLLILDFTAVWCGPCHVMENEVLNEPEVSKYIDEKFVVLKMDVDEPEAYYYTEKFNVNGIPDYTILNISGEQISKHRGSCTKEELLNFFRTLVVDKKLTMEQVDNKLATLQKLYEEKPTAQSLYVYLSFLLKYKNDGALAVKIYKDSKGIKKNNIIQIPKLLAHYFAQIDDENSFKNLIGFMNEKGADQPLISAKALAYYEFYIAKDDITAAKKYLNEYLDVLTKDKSWEDVTYRIMRIKQFAYTYKQYSWGADALNKLKDDYANAYSNKNRLPLSGHFYQLALMNYLAGNCSGAKENMLEYKKYPNGSVASSYKTENLKWIEKMDDCGNTTK
jgi:thioredoxin-related protein